MLSQQDNELMCRIGPGTAMGDAMRRFWLPVAGTSGEIGPEQDWRTLVPHHKVVADAPRKQVNS